MRPSLLSLPRRAFRTGAARIEPDPRSENPRIWESRTTGLGDSLHLEETRPLKEEEVAWVGPQLFRLLLC